jgi:hypothetical protein
VRGVPWLLSLALLARATPSPADDGLPLDLTWSAPPGCATTESIQRELGRIARVRPGRTVAQLTARGSIARTGASYRLTLHTEQNGVAGERSLVAKECRSLEREVTLVLALAFGEGVELVTTDENAGSNAAPPGNGGDDATSSGVGTKSAAQAAESTAATTAPSGTAAPSKTTAPSATTATEKAGVTTAPPSPPPPRATPSPPPRSTSSGSSSGMPGRARIAAFVGGGVLFRALPSPAGFVVVGSELGVRRFWLEPKLAWLPHVEQSLERGVKARYDGFGGGLAGCLAVPPYSWSLHACVGADALDVRGRSSGASESDEAFAPLWSGMASLGVTWPARGFVAVRLEAALHVAFNEPSFLVVGLGEAHQVPRLSPTLGATALFGNAH